MSCHKHFRLLEKKKYLHKQKGFTSPGQLSTVTRIHGKYLLDLPQKAY